VKIAHNPHRSWVAATAGLVLAAVSAVATAQVSLTTVVELAQRNSTTVRVAESDVLKTSAVLAQSKDVYIPNLTIGSTMGTSVGFPTGQPSVANANMQSLVLSFPQRQYIRAARAGLEAAQLELKNAREQVALDVSTTYIELDSTERELDAARQQDVYAGLLIAIEQQRNEAGVDPLSELLQAQLTAAQLKLKRLHLETRADTLSKQLTVLTGLPAGSITPDHASIPEIPALTADAAPRSTAGLDSQDMLAKSKQFRAAGQALEGRRPQIAFGAVYNLDWNKLNNYTSYYKSFTPNNFSFGFSIEVPVFDIALRAKARESAADALQATVEAEEARRKNDVEIVNLTGSLNELGTMAEIASLQEQIAGEQLKTVLAQLELGSGVTGPGAQPQLNPKTEQLARIDERQKYIDSLDSALNLSKARLNLLCALGHMQDWLDELHTK
jgi:outer membrane protein TolC